MAKILRPGDERDIMAARFEIEKKDTFHYENLYEWLHDYLMENEWEDTYPIGGSRFEHYYFQENHQSGKSDQKVWWRVTKQPVDNNYFRYVLLINQRNIGSQPVKVMHQGEKVETFKGNLTFQIEAWMQLDYKNLWHDHWLFKHLEEFYREKFWAKKKEKWKKELWKEAYTISAWIKKYLNMKIPYERRDTFHPEGGLQEVTEGRR